MRTYTKQYRTSLITSSTSPARSSLLEIDLDRRFKGWSDFAGKFCQGGFACTGSSGNPLSNNLLATPGIPSYKVRREETYFQEGRHAWKPRFSYLMGQKMGSPVKLTGSPRVEARTFTDPETKYDYQFQRASAFSIAEEYTTVISGSSWPSRFAFNSGDRSIWANLANYVVTPEKYDRTAGEKLKKYAMVRVPERSNLSDYNFAFRQFLISAPGRRVTRPRWLHCYRPTSTHDFVRDRYSWFSLNQLPTVFVCRAAPVEAGLTSTSMIRRLSRCNMLHQNVFWTSLAARRADRMYVYRRFVFGKFVPNLSHQKFIFQRFRRFKLRRKLLYTFHPGTYLTVATRRGLLKTQTNRLGLLENIRAELPRSPYIEGLHKRRSDLSRSRVAQPLEYNFFKKDTFYGTLYKKRTHKSKEYRLGKHPVWGPPLFDLRTEKWRRLVTSVTGGLLGSAKLSDSAFPADLQDINVAPVVPGWWSGVYWTFHRWGRSKWRTRPSGRAKSTFIKTLRLGVSFEKEETQWSCAGSSSTGVRTSLSVEWELKRPKNTKAYIPPIPRVAWPTRPSRLPRWTKLVNWLTWCGRRVALLATYIVTCHLYFVVLGLLGPFFWLYHLYGRFWCWFFLVFPSIVRYRVLNFLKPVFWLWYFVVRLFWLSVAPIRDLIRYSPVYRNLNWLYFAWLSVFNTEDQNAETNIQEDFIDDEFVHHYAEEEIDYLGENFVESDTLQGNSIHNEQRGMLFSLSFFFNNDLDDYLHDFSDTADDVFLHEIPYYFRLLFTPVIDLFVKLPLWGVLEGISLLGVWFQHEYKRAWYNFLAKPRLSVISRLFRNVIILLKNFIHFVCWCGLFVYLVTLITFDSLKIYVIYELNLTWFDEYYLFWLFFSFGTTVFFMGPSFLKSYIWVELGLDNAAFLLVSPLSLAHPEDYYPHRAPLGIHRFVVDRVGDLEEQGELDLAVFNPEQGLWGPWDRPGNSITPVGTYDNIRAVMAQMYEIPIEQVPHDDQGDEGAGEDPYSLDLGWHGMGAWAFGTADQEPNQVHIGGHRWKRDRYDPVNQGGWKDGHFRYINYHPQPLNNSAFLREEPIGISLLGAEAQTEYRNWTVWYATDNTEVGNMSNNSISAPGDIFNP